MANKKDIKKVVLAYSGGLDTSIIIPWLKENYNNCEVIAVSGDVGQGTELDGLEEKAIKTGASKLYIEDLKEEFIQDYVYPTVQAGAIYENRYMLGTSFARPIIAKRIAEIAIKEGADAICHGCTGKGNDQVRFELAIKAFAPDMQIIAPWREWDIKSRDQEIDYAEAHNIPLKINRETNYSKDKNIWHLSHEGLDLEDPANEPQYEKPGFLEMGVSPIDAPDKPTYVTISFEKGIPVALDGQKMDGVTLIKKLNKLGGENGIGLADLVENRLVGMKSRGVYETPGGTILYKAHQCLETICLDKLTMHEKKKLSVTYAELVYNGQWFTPLREGLSAFADKINENIKKQDIAARYGGDKISVILKNMSHDEAKYMAEYMTYSLSCCLVDDIGPVNKVSVGIATYPDDSMDKEKLLILAEQAVLVSKTKGYNNGHSTIVSAQDYDFWEDTALNSFAAVMAKRHSQLGINFEDALVEQFQSENILSQNHLIEIVTSLASAIDAKDTYTNGHSGRVATYSREIAKRLGYDERGQDEIYMMGLLHDVGKIGVPDAVITKPGRLTEEEFAQIKSHPAKGARILQAIGELPKLAVGARWHHERYDGRGYPDGLKEREIPEEARIIAVADAYDAMTSNRSYRRSMDQKAVREQIEKGKGTQFDPRFADIMIQMIDEDRDYQMRETEGE